MNCEKQLEDVSLTVLYSCRLRRLSTFFRTQQVHPKRLLMRFVAMGDLPDISQSSLFFYLKQSHGGHRNSIFVYHGR